jgi:hypothetical protein
MPRQDEIDLSTEDLDLVAELAKPGFKDSAILTLDSVLTLMRLVKAEAAQAAGAFPQLLGLGLARGPVYLLTWLGFCIFAACGVYAVSGNSVVWGSATFFMLQLVVALILELKIRRLHERIEFPESRKGLAVLQAGLKERLRRERAS